MERVPKDKVIVVTGGARGIGYEISDQFLQSGAKTLIILDILEDVGVNAAKTLNDKYDEGKAVFIKCDVMKDLEKVSEELFQKYQVDVLVNNAGILNEASFKLTMDINCIALVEWSMKFWEYMRTDKGGRGGTIYNIASIYGFEYSPWAVYYKTSKYAVIGFSRTLGHPFNYDKSGVRVIAMCPGFTNTAILAGITWDWHKEGVENVMKNEVIMQTPETIGKAVVEIFTFAETGSVWVKENNEPIKLAPMC
ncbi:hypothetical protein PYW07_009909 [Mythimna separata]|uniref:Uncharacterized protein n=1 Tax=Mythimna separata TaxID=271217 RepID=A0AAD8DQ26_MYTSE|nr:hypothetical protein PYW07_009909 [Mythimna separata]